MKVSKNWLKDYINLDNISNEELEKVINTHVCEIETAWEMVSATNLTIGKVLECVDHPESDHLHVCKVDVGDEILQIVCGAKNVCQGAKVVVAMIGCLMPDSTLIKEGTLKGYKSYGMLCSKRELGIPCEEVRGLYLLDDSYEVGQDFIA